MAKVRSSTNIWKLTCVASFSSVLRSGLAGYLGLNIGITLPTIQLNTTHFKVLYGQERPYLIRYDHAPTTKNTELETMMQKRDADFLELKEQLLMA